MEIWIVAAVSDNGVIGKNNDLIWHMPADLAFFSRQIKGSWLLAGRKSFESPQGRVLYWSRNDVIVVTRQRNYQAGNVHVVNSIQEGIDLAKKQNVKRLCILGGAEIYKQSIKLADKVVITKIHGVFEGDAYFPEMDFQLWKESSREDHLADESNPYAYSFVTYRKK